MSSISNLALAGLEEALNRCIVLDPETADKLAVLHGRVIGLEIPGFELRLFLIPGPARLQVQARYEGEPDCLLRGAPLTLARLGSSGERGADALFAGEVEITGDTELGHRFGEILGGLDIDWEELLSRLTGDVIAHEIGNGVRALTGWGRRSAETLGQDLKEYLQEEIRLLPARPEIAEFLSAVDGLRDDVERMEARIGRLRRGSPK